jgi:hypothetical protein
MPHTLLKEFSAERSVVRAPVIHPACPGRAALRLNQQGSAESFGLLTADWSGMGYPALVSMLKAIM